VTDRTHASTRRGVSTATLATDGLSALDRTYATLKRLILEGEFGPGDRLTGALLEDMLGVSRTPIRSALVRLESDGLIEMTDGRSARVKALTLSEVQHAYDIAAGLEGMLVYRLATEGTEMQLVEISAAVAEMEAAAAVGDNAAWARGDERFHHLLSTYGANPLLTIMMERVDTVIGRLRFLALHLNPDGAALSAHDHRSVTTAMIAGDGHLARVQHQKHWERVRNTNSEFLREGLSRRAPYILQG